MVKILNDRAPNLVAATDPAGRRRALRWLAAGIGGAMGTAAQAADILISDTHSHIAFRAGPGTCMRCGLTESGVNLISWALVSDAPFLQRMPNGSIQVNFKPSVEQLRAAYTRILSGMQRRIRGENLRMALNPEHVDLALQGQLHIVMSTEGAHFLGGDVNYLDVVYENGIRQIGLGHFLEGELLDIRTEAPNWAGSAAWAAPSLRVATAWAFWLTWLTPPIKPWRKRSRCPSSPCCGHTAPYRARQPTGEAGATTS